MLTQKVRRILCWLRHLGHKWTRLKMACEETEGSHPSRLEVELDFCERCNHARLHSLNYKLDSKLCFDPVDGREGDFYLAREEEP